MPRKRDGGGLAARLALVGGVISIAVTGIGWVAGGSKVIFVQDQHEERLGKAEAAVAELQAAGVRRDLATAVRDQQLQQLAQDVAEIKQDVKRLLLRGDVRPARGEGR